MTDQNSECPKKAIDIILSSYYIFYNISGHGFPLIVQGHVMHTLKPDCTSVFSERWSTPGIDLPRPLSELRSELNIGSIPVGSCEDEVKPHSCTVVAQTGFTGNVAFYSS